MTKNLHDEFDKSCKDKGKFGVYLHWREFEGSPQAAEPIVVTPPLECKVSHYTNEAIFWGTEEQCRSWFRAFRSEFTPYYVITLVEGPCTVYAELCDSTGKTLSENT